jgi:hypothetical protein
MIDPASLEKLGVFVAEDGSYKRHRLRIKNVEYDPADRLAMARGKVVAYDEESVPYPVVLPLATDPASIEEARGKAIAAGADFYHPRWGWLRWGLKPEKDHPENLGSGAVKHPTRRVIVPHAQSAVTAEADEPSPGTPPKKGA